MMWKSSRAHASTAFRWSTEDTRTVASLRKRWPISHSAFLRPPVTIASLATSRTTNTRSIQPPAIGTVLEGPQRQREVAVRIGQEAYFFSTAAAEASSSTTSSAGGASFARGSSSSSGGRLRTATAVLGLLGVTMYLAKDNGPLAAPIRGSAFYGALVDHIGVPLLRLLDPEDAHNLTVFLLKNGLGPKLCAASDGRPVLSTSLWGLNFDNCLGMAAGFDKHAEVAERLLTDVGFGFVEVGGVTPLPQDGNPKPRCFRLTEDRAVINRYGLNSHGHEIVAERLKQMRAKASEEAASASASGSTRSKIFGVNLAKNTAGTATAEEDYRAGVRALGPWVDFFVVNVSCPNVSWTKGLAHSDIADLAKAVCKERDELAGRSPQAKRRPVLLKIGPDNSDAQLRQLVAMSLANGVDGLVVSNTSAERPVSLQSSASAEKGGLSGAPIREKALETCRMCYRLTEGRLPIVGVGGISSAEDAYQRIRAGASLLEIYTVMVYEGPGCVARIASGLEELLQRDGFKNVKDAVGVDAKK